MAYRIFGSDNSPYSQKVLAYFRFKGLDHQWFIKAQHEEEYDKYAKLPIVPLVVHEDKGQQDSTPIIESVEALHPQPSVHPPSPGLRFLSELMEEFGDGCWTDMICVCVFSLIVDVP
jgi:glutathione S-transferase